MVITWYGKNCFKLQNGDLVLVTDPFEKESQLSPFRGRADIVIRTLGGAFDPQPPETFEISYPGEYEVKGVFIKGWSLGNRRTIFLAEWDDFKIAFLGHLAAEEEIKTAQEFLEDIDIVFMPAGGPPFIEPAAAAKLVRQLKPCLVVPALFREPKEIKLFLKELGQNEAASQEKLTVAKKDLVKEKLIIGCLKI